MNEMIFCSDPEPRHRRWFNCLRMPFEFKYMLSSELQILAQVQDLVFQSSEPLLIRDRDGNAKRTYVLGMRAGLAHCVEVLKNTKVQMSPEATEMYCKKVGKRIRHDADGNVVPMSMDIRDMVAVVSRGREYPDDHEFQSTAHLMLEWSLFTSISGL